MRFQVGQKVGDYEFLAVEETTPTGATYRVHNILAARDEVLKVLPRDVLDDTEGVERFLREAKIHARMQHPNIAAFYTATRMEGQLVMTSECIEGKSLAHYISSGAISIEQAARYFEQVLSALSYAHREGVVHRDLTPNNLIIAANDSVKVTGFALAKKSSDPQLTQPGIVLGSVHYMSPEQVKGSTELDRRSDIYSLGVVLYEAVTGKKPFDSKSDFDVFFAHVNKDPEPPSKVRSDIPVQFDRLVMTAMAKHPGNRFQTADEFRDSLNQFRDSLGQLRSVVDATAAESRPVSTVIAHAPASETLVAQESAVLSVATPAAHSQPYAPATRELKSLVAEMPRVPAQLPGWEDPPRSHDFVKSDAGPARSTAPNPNGDLGTFISSRPEWNLKELRTPPSRVTKDPWSELDEQANAVPPLLRSTGEDGANWRGTPSPAPDPPAESSSDGQVFAGWTSKDILAVGALTFVIVAAVFFVMLTFLNR